MIQTAGFSLKKLLQYGSILLIWLGMIFGAQAQSVKKAPSSTATPLQTVHRLFLQVERPHSQNQMPFRQSLDSDRGWRPIDIEDVNPYSRQDIWLKLILPQGNWHDPELFLQMPVRNFEVYQEGRLIYKSRDGIHETRWNRSGLRIHFVHLEATATRSPLYIRIRADRFSYLKMWGNIQIGERADYLRKIFRNDFADMVITLICIFVGFCFLIAQTFNAKRYLLMAGLGQFTLCYGVLRLLELVSGQLIWDAPTLKYYLETLAFYYMPVGLIFFVGTFVDPTISFLQMKPVYKRLMHAFTIHAFLMFGLDSAGIVRGSISYPIYCICLLGVIIYLGVKGFQATRAAHLDIKLVIIGIVCLMFAAVHDVTGVIRGNLLLGKYISNWGMLVFILCMALFMIKRFIGVNSELTDLNRNLENRVQQRTEELEKANEKLEELNEELNSALQNLQETQLQLIQTGKMALLGNLVTGIAREINTPLGTIISNVKKEKQRLHQMAAADPAVATGTVESPAYLNDAARISEINRRALDRMIGLVRGLKNFARLDEADRKVADLHEGIDSALLILNHQLKGRIEVIKEYGQIPPFLCFPQQLNQVFLNLLLNASQAMSGSGERANQIVIRTRYADHKIVICFKDTGPGIPTMIVSQVFRPRFTTKENSAGLGLAVCAEIIEKHRGRIWVESEPGNGAAFLIELPA